MQGVFFLLGPKFPPSVVTEDFTHSSPRHVFHLRGRYQRAVLRKILQNLRNSVETPQKISEIPRPPPKDALLRQERVQTFCGKFAKKFSG